jgi:hypothetical protein
MIGFLLFSFAKNGQAGVAATRACERNEVKRASEVGQDSATRATNVTLCSIPVDKSL